MKTPAKVIELMKRQESILAHVDEVLRVKATVPVENQADHVRNKSADYYIGLADGANTMLEEALHRSKCYAGFGYLGKSVTHADGVVQTIFVGPSNPDFAEWRRRYFTKN